MSNNKKIRVFCEQKGKIERFIQLACIAQTFNAIELLVSPVLLRIRLQLYMNIEHMQLTTTTHSYVQTSVSLIIYAFNLYYIEIGAPNAKHPNKQANKQNIHKDQRLNAERI